MKGRISYCRFCSWTTIAFCFSRSGSAIQAARSFWISSSQGQPCQALSQSVAAAVAHGVAAWKPFSEVKKMF